LWSVELLCQVAFPWVVALSSCLEKVREARLFDLKYFLAVFGRFMLECMHSVFLSIEMELHVGLGVDLGGFRRCMWVDSGERCYFRPSELISPRREYQSTHHHESSPRRPVHVLSDAMSRSGEEVSPEREIVNNPTSPISLEREFVKGSCHASRLSENA